VANRVYLSYLAVAELRLSVLLPFSSVFEVLFENVAPETFLATLGSVEFELIALRPVEITELVDLRINTF